MEKKDLIERIKTLKKEKNAVILAHYYQNSEIQEICDYIGDSYHLSKIARDTDADIIIFCGVKFMAETAKILSPNKKVLIPRIDAGCFMADQVIPYTLKKYLNDHPNTKVISYVNTTADVKALTDVCVTSSNAKQVVKNFIAENGDDYEYLYLPDKNLANYLNITENLNLKIWNGCCGIHNALSVDDVLKMKLEHPNAEVVIHPEAKYEVVKLADYAGSTKGIIEYCKNSDKDEFIVGTEKGILYELNKSMPNKKFYLLSEKLVCRTMKYIDLENLLECLIDEKYEITLDEETIKKAQKSLDEMFRLANK